METAQLIDVQIDCESPESLRLENSEVDRTNHIIFFLPSWVTSLLAHAILLLLLACVTFPEVGDALPQILTMLPASESQDDEYNFVRVDADQTAITTGELLDSLVDGFDDQLSMAAVEEDNFMVLRKILWKNDLLLTAEDVGGNKSRTMSLQVGSGRVLIRSQEGQEEL